MLLVENKTSSLNNLLDKSMEILNKLAPILLIVFLIKSLYKKEIKNIIFWSGFLIIGYFYNNNETTTQLKTMAFYAVDTLQEWIMLIIEFILDLA